MPYNNDNDNNNNSINTIQVANIWQNFCNTFHEGLVYNALGAYA